MEDKLLIITIKVITDGKTRVNINLPYQALKLALKANIDSTLLQSSNSLKDVDFKQIVEMVQEGKRNELINRWINDHEQLIIGVE